MHPANLTRRGFGQQTLGCLLTWSLLETLIGQDALASDARPTTEAWLRGLHELGADLKGEKIDQPTWQTKIEELLTQVELADLLRKIDFEKLTREVKFAERGERSLRFSFPRVEGLPAELSFGKQVFALRRGRSVVPHGHNNMATAFLILKGELRGRHYDRQQDEAEHLIVKPTIDRTFRPGECSTVSDFKDNVHWFEALSGEAFIFNLHVLDVNPGSTLETGRVYLDPQGERLADGLIRARRISFEEANRLYG